MLEENVSEERDLDLNEEEDIIMEVSRKEKWRYVSKDGENESNIHALGWDIYTIEKEELINREFLVSIPHPKVGNIVWTCVKDNITEEN